MNFRRWVVFTFLVHVLVVVVDKGGGLILYLLTANQPDQHGKSGIAASLPFILGAIANLGLATAMVYLVRRGRFTAQVAFENSMGIALLWGSFIAASATFGVLVVLPWLVHGWHMDWFGVVPICAAVPFLLIASFANSTQLATDHIRDYGVVHLVTSIGFLPAFFAVFFMLGGTIENEHVPFAVAWGRLASTFVVAVLTLWLVRRVVTLRVRFDRQYLTEAVRFGWKANLTSTLSYLNHRLDLTLLFMIGFAEARRLGFGWHDAEKYAATPVAFYSMAVTWAELVWHFPEAMRDLFFSKVAGSSHDQARALTPVLSRLGLLLSLLGAIAIVLLINPVMGTITHLAKGSDHVWYADWSEPVRTSLFWLIPGTVAFTVSKVLQADLAARARLQTCVNAQLAVFATMIALDFVLIPGRGASGAAMASTIAYLLGSVWTIWAYGRETGTSVWSCLFVQRVDFGYIRAITTAVLGKLKKRT